jgi:hypothetical protein
MMRTQITPSKRIAVTAPRAGVGPRIVDGTQIGLLPS